MSHAADRNVLFGVLALRMDFITGEQLLAALNAWVREKNHSLGRVLVAQQALTPKRQAMLDSLVEEHLEQHVHDAEKSLAAVRATPALPDAMRLVPDDELQACLAAFAVTPTPPSGNGKPGEVMWVQTVEKI